MPARPLRSLVGALAFCMTAGAANAVTFVGFQNGLNAGESLATTFEGGPTLGDATFLLSGFSLGGSATLYTGSLTNITAAPATSTTTRDTTQYLSVQRGQTATLDTPLLQAISFYVGSLDGFNRFTFHLADGSTQFFTGAMLSALPATDANGDQTGFTTNGRLTFSFLSPIDSVMFASSGNALEVSDIGILPSLSLVPEPAAWALMILGFGGVGGVARARRAMRLA